MMKARFLAELLILTCFQYIASISDAAARHQKVSVVSGKPRFVSQPTWPTQTYYEQDGPQFTIDCRLVPDPTVHMKWLKDGKQLPQTSGDLYLSNSNQSLTFTRPQTSDKGQYKCVGWNAAGNVSYERSILIVGRNDEVPPVVVETAPTTLPVQALPGQQVNISCVFSVGGSETALVNLITVWRHYNEVVNDTSHTTWGIDTQPGTNNRVLSLYIDSLEASDYGDYMCYGSNSVGNDSHTLTIQRPDNKQKETWPLWVYITIGVFGFVAIVIVTLTTVGCYRYRMNRKYETLEWEEPDVSQYDVPAPSYEYDVFISYSSEDQSWVKDRLFVKLMEQNYKVCVDFKDFTPGMAIAENIMDAVYKSRKTIVLMSRNFLKSMWGQFELQQAHNRAITQGIWRLQKMVTTALWRQYTRMSSVYFPEIIKRADILILVKYDSCKVPAKLMGKTFLDWTNKDVKPHFWQRLYEAIGEPVDFTTNSEENSEAVNTRKADDTSSVVIEEENQNNIEQNNMNIFNNAQILPTEQVAMV